MNTLIDTFGLAIWRASWQAAFLALIVLVLVRICGDRLTAQWRFLLWGVVLARLLLVATPGSDWSVFNLARWNSGGDLQPVAQLAEDAPLAAISQVYPSNPDLVNPSGDLPPVQGLRQVANAHQDASSATPAMEPIVQGRKLMNAVFTISTLVILCIVVGLVAAFQMIRTTFMLRRRLSVCRPVTDPGVVRILVRVLQIWGTILW